MRKPIIELDAAAKKRLIEAVGKYNDENFDLDLGDLALELYYQFLMDEIGALFYNQGIADAKSFINEKAEDLYVLMK